MPSIQDIGAKVQCRHKDTETTTTAGLRRTVCRRCGTVSIDYVEDVFAEERQQLGKHTR